MIDEIRAIAKDKTLLKQVLVESQSKIEHELQTKQTERDDLNKELKQHRRAIKQLATDQGDTTERIADLIGRITDGEHRLPNINARIVEFEQETISPSEAQDAFADFDTLWSNLIPREQARLLKLLISTVEYDASHERISVTFRPSSIRALLGKSIKEAA